MAWRINTRNGAFDFDSFARVFWFVKIIDGAKLAFGRRHSCSYGRFQANWTNGECGGCGSKSEISERFQMLAVKVATVGILSLDERRL